MLLSMSKFIVEVLIPVLQVLFIIAMGFLTWVLFKTACALEGIEDDIHDIKKFIDRIDLID
jgi:hypothetical protein